MNKEKMVEQIALLVNQYIDNKETAESIAYDIIDLLVKLNGE